MTEFSLPPEPESELEKMKKQVREEYEDKNHIPITPDNFREMARFFEQSNQDLMAVFMAFQEKFKIMALAAQQFADLLDREGKLSDKKTQNVFEQDATDDPGPINHNSKGN